MKYLLEEKIDFFDELNKNLLKEDTNSIEESNICLITCKPLTNKYVTMECGHKFNYIPLYYDILNHKQKFNSMESRSNHLKLDEIRCPYCRKKQIGILPFYEEFGLEKVNGVNVINEINNKESDFCYMSKYCLFELLESSSIPTSKKEDNPTTPEQESEIKVNYVPIYCNNNKMVKLDKYSKDKPWYCSIHKKIMIAKEKKEKKEKEKQEKLILKLTFKNEKKEKNKKVEKILSKVDELNNFIQEENKMVEISNSSINSCACIHILKSGPNKGKTCNNKIFLNDFCKRHSSE